MVCRAAAIVIAGMATAGLLAGCSVGMALSGLAESGSGRGQDGATRGEIELHLGTPIRSTLLAGGHRADLYALCRCTSLSLLSMLIAGAALLAGRRLDGAVGFTVGLGVRLYRLHHVFD